MKKAKPFDLKQIKTALKGKNWTTRYDAIARLEHIPEQGSVPILITYLLNDEHKYVRQTCVEVLSKLKPQEAVDALIHAMLNDSYYYVCELCAIALAEIGDKKAFDPIVQIIENKKGIKKYQYINALGKFKDRRAIPIIAKKLITEDNTLIYSVDEALSQINDKESVICLIDFLKKNKNQNARAYTINALGKLKDKDAVLPILQVNCQLLELNIVSALNQIGDFETYLDLIIHEPVKNQLTLIKALKDSKNTIVFDKLEKLYRSNKNINIRLEIVKILFEFKDKAQYLSKEDFILNEISLGQWNDLKAYGLQIENILLSTVKTNNIKIKIGIIKLLGAIKSINAISFLCNMLRSKNQQIRTHAAISLGEIGHSSGIHALLSALEIKSNEKSYGDCRTYVITALAKIGDLQAIIPINLLFENLLNDKDTEEYLLKSIIQSLTSLKSSISKHPLLSASRHKNQNIRNQAANAIEALSYTLSDYEKLMVQIAKQNWSSPIFMKENVIDSILKIFPNENKYNQRQLAYNLCKKGNLIASETILKWLFTPVITFSKNEIANEIEKFENLFGIYTETILYTSVYLNCTSPPSTSSTTEYFYDFNESMRFIENLVKKDSAIANNILHLIAQKSPIEVLEIENEEYYSHFDNFNFAAQKQLAKEILSRKNNPAYQPEAYLDKESWKD